MSKFSPEEQIRFLIVCIHNSNNGKPDFGAVASKMDIVSKGAAARRYERLVKASGVSGKGKVTTVEAPDGEAVTAAAPREMGMRKRKATSVAPKIKAPKKTKRAVATVKTAVKSTQGEDNSESALSDAPEEFDMEESNAEA